MLFSEVRLGNSAYDWNTMPKSRSEGGNAEISLPACMTVPEVCISRPAIARRKVVLPQPEGPRKQMNSPSYTSSDTLSSAVKSPNFLLNRSILRYGFTLPLLPACCSLISISIVGDGISSWYYKQAAENKNGLTTGNDQAAFYTNIILILWIRF